MQSFETRIFDEAAGKKLASEIVHELTRGLVDELEQEIFEILSNQGVDDFKTANRAWNEILRAYDATVSQWNETREIACDIVFKKRPSLRVVRNDEQ
jgi:hypothetical protein